MAQYSYKSNIPSNKESVLQDNDNSAETFTPAVPSFTGPSSHNLYPQSVSFLLFIFDTQICFPDVCIGTNDRSRILPRRAGSADPRWEAGARIF